MLKKDVVLRGIYIAKVSGKLTRIRLTGESKYGGWDAINEGTGRAIRIKSAAKLRRLVAMPIYDEATWNRASDILDS